MNKIPKKIEAGSEKRSSDFAVRKFQQYRRRGRKACSSLWSRRATKSERSLMGRCTHTRFYVSTISWTLGHRKYYHNHPSKVKPTHDNFWISKTLVWRFKRHWASEGDFFSVSLILWVSVLKLTSGHGKLLRWLSHAKFAKCLYYFRC